MVSARGIRAGAAYVELYANDNKLVRGLRMARRRLKAFSASAQQVGTSLLRMSAVFATPFIAGTKIFADFEQQLANVSTMLDDPSVHMENFRKEVRRMAMEFGESTETLAGGLYDILSASVPANKALSVLAVSAKAAKAGMTDTATAADAITTVLNSYGLSADRAADISDLLFSVVKRGKTTFAELAPNIGNVANIASTAGLGLNEMGASIALLTRNGIKSEEAITALRAIISGFLKPSAEGATLARKLGFEMNTASLKAEGLAGVFQKISKLPPDAIATLFPNIRALKGVLPALQSLKGFTTDIGAMQKRAGTTETAYAKMTSTLAHSFAKLKQSAVAVLAVIGESLAGPLAKAAKVVGRYLGMIREWIGKNKEMVVTALKVTVVIGLVAGTLITLGTAGAALAFVFGGIASIISLVGTIFATLGTILGAILSPIGLVIAGVVALGGYILYSTGIGAKALSGLGDHFAALKADAKAAWKGIGDALAAGDIGLAAKILWLTLKMEWQRGIHALHQTWIRFKEAFLSVITGAFYGAQVYLVDAWAGLQKGWVSTVSFLAKVWSGFTTGLQRGWNTAGGFIQKRFLEVMGLFDSELDVEMAKKITDQKISQMDQGLLAGLSKQVAQADAQREERKLKIAGDRDRAVTEIARVADQEDQVRREQYKQEMAGSESALVAARKEWREAIAEAGSKKPLNKGSDGKTPQAGAQVPVIDTGSVIRGLKDQLSGVAQSIDQGLARTTRVDVLGTFNVAAAQGLGAGTAADRTAKATEDTARNTKRLVTEMGLGGGLVFS